MLIRLGPGGLFCSEVESRDGVDPRRVPKREGVRGGGGNELLGRIFF